MEYEITSSMNKDILEITISGQGSKENRSEIVMKVVDLVRRAEPRCVLIDVRSIRGPLGVIETYDIVDSYPKGTPHIRAAIVDAKEHKRQTNFYETVSVNVGYAIQYFTDMDAARAWLNS